METWSIETTLKTLSVVLDIRVFEPVDEESSYNVFNQGHIFTCGVTTGADKLCFTAMILKATWKTARLNGRNLILLGMSALIRYASACHAVCM